MTVSRGCSSPVTSVFIALSIATLASPVVFGADVTEEIVVTGSRIARDPRDSASPLDVVKADDLSRAGLSAVGDAVRLLPANSGSEFNLDVFTQNLSSGTSNFNLRGLGLNATLVLINGRRQVVSGGVADDGSTFVDLNALMPMIMMERLEVLKDGAAALYGTDAVAGVANYLTRDKFSGVEARIDNSTTTRSGQDDLTVSGLIGGGNDRWHAVAGASYLHRSALSAADRAFTAGKSYSSFGQPGAFILSAPSPIYPDLPVGSSIIDPACGGVAGGIPNPRNPQPAGVTSAKVGTCTFDFSSYYDLVPEERRWNSYGTGHIDLSDTLTVFGEVGYARERVSRGTSPSFPLVSLVTVPANNPGNIFGTPVLFLGRALGALAGRDTVHHASDTWRGVAGARGDLGLGDWRWEVVGTYSANAFYVGINDVLADRFIAALNGRGGPNNNLFFNPFGSAASAKPGDATYNDPAVIKDFISLNTYNYSTTLAALDASVTGKVGQIGLAFGGQLRRESFRGDQNDAFNAQNYLFSIGGPDFYGARTTWALFGEARVPLVETLEGQVALRHDDGGSGFRSTDPKIGLLWRPDRRLSIRGSFATSFRAPSVFQSFAVSTIQENISDPITGTTSFRSVRTLGSTSLKPEQATVANIGLTVEPVTNLTLSVDGWRYDYDDIIVKQSAQGLINANPNDPRIIRQSGQIVRIETAYVNASSALTDGLDLAARYRLGEVSFNAEGTYLRRFLIQNTPTSPVVDVAGNRNYNNFARSLPQWRGQVGALWQHDRHGLGTTVRLVSSYRDDQNGNVLIPGQATVDVQYTLALAPVWGMKDGPELAIGALNLADRDPPSVGTNAGYDSKVHDPRGRVVYVRIKAGW